MTFYSIQFILFFIVFSIILSVTKSVEQQRYVYLAANIAFYAYWDYRFLFLLFAVILICYVSTYLYSRNGNKVLIYFAVFICLITLGVFKYFNFFTSSFTRMFGVKDYVSLNIILPLGISFYLFQMMSYLFDVLYGRIEMERDFVKVAAYISFFPQITSGPIVKAKDFLPQLNTLHKIKKENVYEGLQLFLIGLTKKIVFADRIGSAVDAVYAAPAAYNGISVLFAVIGYSLQIYCDFSGYSNMAIGIAKIWDFDLGDNFNAPYIAKNPSDFWRRWHISLSTWFRDYVYIPLGGNRKGKLRTYFNLFITMVLSGLWHGANITFIVWGAVHGLGSAFHKAYKDAIFDKKVKSGEPTTISKIISILCTFVFVSAAWVLFRADSLRDAADIYRSLFNTTGAMYINIYVAIYIIFFIAIHFYEIKKNNGRVLSINLDLDKFKSKLIIAFWVWAIVLFMYCGNSAFIYAQF